MKIIFTLCTCIITVLFFSCQREPLEVLPEEETPPPVDPVTCVLDTFQIDMKSEGQSFLFTPKKALNFNTITYVDSSDGNFKYVDSLVYDNQKRLKEIYSSSFVPPNNYSTHKRTEISYSADGKVSKKLATWHNNETPTETDSLIILYRYIGDKLSTIIKLEPFAQRTYAHMNPSLIAYQPYLVSDSIVLTWTGDNITHLKNYVYNIEMDGSFTPYIPSDDISFEYDLSKTNPFNPHTPFLTLLTQSSNDLPSQPIAWSGKNLIKKITDNRRNEPNAEDLESYSYTYTFNTKGEITKIYMKSDSNLYTQEFSLTFNFFSKCQ